jgi:hypothetical protein
MSLGDDTGPVRASDDPTNRGQVAQGADTDDDPAGHEHRGPSQAVDALELAKAWLLEDPDPDTRAELAALLDRGDAVAVGERFAGRLEFGTAGLRGPLGAGPMCMNRVVVRRAAAGLVAHLKRHAGRSVVIGYDARHKSDVFAADTAAVVTGAGLQAYVLPRPLPTPVLAFAIRHLDADAGVMVTASHNPPQDNGYKVYLGDGSQIVPPADAEISAAIAAVGPLATVPHGALRGDAGRGGARRLSRPRRLRGGARLAAGRVDRLHAHARCGGRDGAGRLRPGGLPGAPRGGAAGRPGPRLPDRLLPQPGGARGDGPRPGRRRLPGRRPRHR